MDGVELTPEEFAYLLSVVHAPAVVGIEDPKLFPSGAKTQDTVYGKGRKQLEEHQWIEPIPDHDDEYALNPTLVQMVAVIAGAEHVVATVQSTEDDTHQAMLHYLFGDKIVELWATPDKRYLIGTVEGRAGLLKRIAELVRVPESSDQAAFSLPEAAFQKVAKLAENGKSDKAEALLEKAGDHAQAFFAALAERGDGQLFVVQPNQGQIETGRKATVVGGAWLVTKPAQDADELDIASLDLTRLESLLTDWLE